MLPFFVLLHDNLTTGVALNADGASATKWLRIDAPPGEGEVWLYARFEQATTASTSCTWYLETSSDGTTWETVGPVATSSSTPVKDEGAFRVRIDNRVRVRWDITGSPDARGRVVLRSTHKITVQS